MLYYSPPKSSIWGHLMGRRSPASFRAGVKAFIDNAVRSHEVTSCAVSVYLSSVKDAAAAAFAGAFLAENDVPMNLTARPGPTEITGHVFEECLEWYVAHHLSLPKGDSVLFSLVRRYHVHEWSSQEISDCGEAGGALAEGYGNLQYLTTMLGFSGIAEYRYVQKIAKRTLAIRMNDRHIRPQKALEG